MLKADVAGSLEALRGRDRQAAAGRGRRSTSSTAASAASTSPTSCSPPRPTRVILGFNVRPVGDAAPVADREGVEIRTYSVIYKRARRAARRDAGHARARGGRGDASARPRSAQTFRASRDRHDRRLLRHRRHDPPRREGAASCATARSSTTRRSSRCARFNDDVREVADRLRVRHRARELPGRQGRRRPRGLRDAPGRARAVLARSADGRVGCDAPQPARRRLHPRVRPRRLRRRPSCCCTAGRAARADHARRRRAARRRGRRRRAGPARLRRARTATTADPAEAYSADAQADSVCGLIEELELERPVVVRLRRRQPRRADGRARSRPTTCARSCVAPPLPGRRASGCSSPTRSASSGTSRSTGSPLSERADRRRRARRARLPRALLGALERARLRRPTPERFDALVAALRAPGRLHREHRAGTAPGAGTVARSLRRAAARAARPRRRARRRCCGRSTTRCSRARGRTASTSSSPTSTLHACSTGSGTSSPLEAPDARRRGDQGAGPAPEPPAAHDDPDRQAVGDVVGPLAALRERADRGERAPDDLEVERGDRAARRRRRPGRSPGAAARRT